MQAWTKEKIVETLASPLENRKAVSKMLQSLYNKQTASEKAIGDTAEHNGAGFNGVDGKFLSSVAENSKRYNGSLTDGQTKAVAKSLKKYAAQLAKISQEVAEKVEALKGETLKGAVSEAVAVAKGEECAGCNDKGGPSHQASQMCQSGGRNHCTCNTCF